MAMIRRGEAGPLAQRTQGWDPFQMMRELMGWDPFQEMAPRFFRGAEGGMVFVPAFDVRETKDAYVFKADLPGFRDQDIDLNVTGNRLTVSGKREVEQVEETQTFFLTERSYGAFTRSFTLPEGINAEQIQADLKDGVLSVHVPKSVEAQPKRISITGGGQTKEKKIKA